MRTSQLVCAAAAAVALTATAACNRQPTEADVREAAREAKVVAASAGEKIADSWLTTKIQAQYFADNDIKARYINVSARDGVVTLRGSVDKAEAHRQAVEIARNTDGVKQVRDELVGPTPEWSQATIDVKEPSVASPPAPVATTGAQPSTTAAAVLIDDPRITAMIQSKFFVDEMIKARRIWVDTRQGVVTLRGDVASESERAQALRLARTTDGVQRVEDSLTVDVAASTLPSTTITETAAPDTSVPAGAQGGDMALESTIQSTFSRDAQLKGISIGITAKDGVVLLEGTMPNQAAKQKALTTARETEGVVQVVDRLSVRTTRR